MSKFKKTFAVIFAVMAAVLMSTAVWAEQYDLKVAGTNVTSTNASDILNNGVFKYDNDTKTLTVSGDYQYNDSNYLIYNSGIIGLTLELKNNAQLTSDFGIIYYGGGSTTITGKGAFSTTAGKYAVQMGERTGIVIENADISFSAKNTAIAYGGSYFSGGSDLIIKNSNVNAASQDYYAIGVFQSISLQSCSITTPSNPEIKGDAGIGSNKYVYDAENKEYAKNVIIHKDVSVTYDAANAVGEKNTETYNYGTTVTLPECEFTFPAGYIFIGWKLDDNIYKAGEEITVLDDITITAQWRNNCIITFDPNEGTGNMNNAAVSPGTAYTLPENQFGAPSGNLMFTGWLIDGQKYQPGDKVTVSNDITVKAVWGERDYWIVGFDRGVGSGTMSSVHVPKNSLYTLPESTFTAPVGYRFKDWKAGGINYAVGDKIKITNDITFTAQYRNRYVVSFNANGGAGSMDDITVVVGAKLTLPQRSFTAPTTNHMFTGWLVGDKTYKEGDEVEISDDITVYALWEERDYWIVKFDANGGVGSMDELHVKYNGSHSITLPECSFTNTIYFHNWNINGTSFQPGTELSITSDITVTAVWRNCTVNYYPNNGTGSSVVRYEKYLTEISLPKYNSLGSDFTAPAGQEFDHWEIDGNAYNELDKVMIYKDVTNIKAIYVYVGTCGDNCTWRFDEITGTLNVSGTGKMTAYGKDNRPPWYDLKNKIKKVVVEDGITYVGGWSFEGCIQLKEAVLADSVKTIGPYSFRNTGLTGINIPKKLSNIGNDAFVNTALTYIIMPETITYTLSNCVGYNCDTSTSPYTYTKADGFVVCGYAGTAAEPTAAETYANNNGFDFIQLGNVNNDANHVVDKADAALLLKYIDGTAALNKKQTVAAKMTDSIKDAPDMLDVIAILNAK